MYGSRNLGNSKEEIAAAVQIVRGITSQLEMHLDESEMSWVSKIDSW